MMTVKPRKMEPRKLRDAIAHVKAMRPSYTPALLSMQREYDESIPVMATNGKKLLWNDECFDEFSLEDLSKIIIHEVLHKWLMHPKKMGKYRNTQMANIAADLSVNSMLVMQEGWVPMCFLLPGRGSFRHFPTGLTMEEYMELLEKDADDDQNQENENNDESQEDGDGSSGDSNEGGDTAGDETENGDGDGDESQEGSGDSDGGTGQGNGDQQVDGQQDDHSADDPLGKTGDSRWCSNEDGLAERYNLSSAQERMLSDVVENEEQDDIQQLQEMTLGQEMATPTDMGAMTLGKILGNIGVGKVNWRKVLKNIMVPANRRKRTFARESRRQSGGFILPAYLPDTKVHKVAVVVDVSGSMYEITRDVMAEMGSMASSHKELELDIITCNTGVVQRAAVKSRDDMDVFIANMKVGGSTDMTPGFAAAMEKTPKVIICITDMEFYRFPPNPGCKVIWAHVWGMKTNAPYGVVLPIQ